MPAPRSQPRKKKPRQQAQATPAAAKPSAPRWRMAPHPDGVSEAPVRVTSRQQREREQAVADLYGDTPLPSTGERLFSISSVLAEVLSQLDIKEAQLAPELLAGAWKQAVGAFLFGQSRLVSLVDGVAGACTSHPAVRFELQRNKKHIIQALNAALGEGSVHSLRIYHG